MRPGVRNLDCDDDADFRDRFLNGLQRLAFVSVGESTNAEDIESTDRGFAQLVKQVGIKAGQPILLYGDRSQGLIRIIGRCVAEGIPFLLMDRSHARIEAEEAVEKLRLRCAYSVDDGEVLADRKPSASVFLPGAMYLVMSSGTTGGRKCSVVSYRAFSRLEAKIHDYLDRENITLNTVHVINKVEFGFFLWDILLMAFVARHAKIYRDTRSLQCSDEESPDAVSMTPSMLTHMLARESVRLPRYIFLSGEKISRYHVKEFERSPALQKIDVYSSYALTESGGQIAMAKLSGDSLQEGVAGHLLDGATIELCEPSVETPSGRAFRIHIKTDTLASAFLTERGLQPLMRDRLYATDDFGTTDQHCGFRIAHRSPGRPKRNGVIVDLEYLRQALLARTSCNDVILESAVFGETEIVVSSVLMPPSEVLTITAADILQTLGAGARPDLVVVSNKLSLTNNGKLLSPFKYAQQAAAASGDKASVLHWVCTVIEWAGLPRIDGMYHAGLMDLGANSLLVAVLRDALTVFFNQDITLAALYACPSIEGIADLVMSERQSTSADSERTSASRKAVLPDGRVNI